MGKKNVFVIMPFQEDFFEVYKKMKAELGASFEFSNAGEEGNQQNILKDIIIPIYKADVVIADLTGVNPNVMYELGVAHSLNKKTIMITQDELSKLPFDLKSYRANQYSKDFSKINKLIETLKINLNGAIDNTVDFGNPIIDNLKLLGINVDFYPLKKEDFKISEKADESFFKLKEKIDKNIEDLKKQIINFAHTILDSNLQIKDLLSNMNCMSQEEVKKSPKITQEKIISEYSIILDKINRNLKTCDKAVTDSWNSIKNDIYVIIKFPYLKNDQSRLEFFQDIFSSFKDLKRLYSGITSE